MTLHYWETLFCLKMPEHLSYEMWQNISLGPGTLRLIHDFTVLQLPWDLTIWRIAVIKKSHDAFWCTSPINGLLVNLLERLQICPRPASCRPGSSLCWSRSSGWPRTPQRWWLGWPPGPCTVGKVPGLLAAFYRDKRKFDLKTFKTI